MPRYPIVDYVMYFNEIELLELRYHVLRDHVTQFVIAEGNHTFSGREKNLVCEQDIQRLGLPRDRFRVITVDLSLSCLNRLPTDDAWARRMDRPKQWETVARQRQQRDALMEILPEFTADTVFLMGDIDEIPRPHALEYVSSMLDQHKDYILKLPLVSLEGRADQQLIDEDHNEVWWDRSLLMCRRPHLDHNTPWRLRSEQDVRGIIGHAVTDNRRSNDLGWHFTWMGTPARRVTKIQACAHGINPDTINNMSDRTRREISADTGQDITFQRRLSTRSYSRDQLPPEIWQLPRVQRFLLPDIAEPRILDSKHTFVHQVLEAGGAIQPLLVPAGLTNGTGLFNPSVMVVDGEIMTNVRHCQYTLLHMEKNRLEHDWGPLLYLHPENDPTLTTTNYWARLDQDLTVTDCYAVDTTGLDVKPLWEFVGLEDVRMVCWNDKIYYCGVRRDTTTNGQGRMELSEIDVTQLPPRETSRRRMPAPGENRSYCEKNWMPVVSMPFTFVKWCNPTEVVRFDPETQTTEQIYLGEWAEQPHDFRGGSQVIDYHGHRVALTHVSLLYNSESGRKDGTYRHRFVVWDRDWRVVRYHDAFSFLGAKIEFCCGMALHGDDVLITFGVQDNAAYILRVPDQWLREVLGV